MMLSNSLLQAAVSVGEAVFSKPYTNTTGSVLRANFYYKCKKGNIIQRPNHPILVPLRSLHYLEPIIAYYQENGTDEVKNFLKLIDNHEIEKIQYLILFYVSGRENELGFADNPKLYGQFRKNAENNLINYFSNKENKSPFTSDEDVKNYAQLLRGFELDKLDDAKSKAILLLMRSCHDLNLIRCYSHRSFMETINNTFNRYSKYKDTRNLQSLIYYAQNCTIATGDKLRTQYKVDNIIGVHEQLGFGQQLEPCSTRPTITGNNSIVFAAKGYDEELFTESCRTDEEGIKKTMQRINAVKKPFFYHAEETTEEYTPERTKQVIESGNGVTRIINGSYFRLEVEQLMNPKYIRPVRNKKMEIDHSNYYDLETGKYIKRREKDHVEVSNQPYIDKPLEIKEYKADKEISKNEDRGKPKNTIFTKKQSYSLLSPDGMMAYFKGKLYDRIKSIYLPVGTLFNLEGLERKGERYVWERDVRTSGYKGYFWLAKESEKSKNLLMPSLDIERHMHRRSVDKLKEYVKTPEGKNDPNEMLMCASLKSLEAIFATEDTRYHRLGALYIQSILKIDYGCSRPLLIMNKQFSPKEYAADQIKRDLSDALKKYRRWHWRLLNFFKPTAEYKLLLKLIGLVSKQGMGIGTEELSKSILDVHSFSPNRSNSQTKIFEKLKIQEPPACTSSLDQSETTKAEIKDTSSLNAGQAPQITNYEPTKADSSLAAHSLQSRSIASNGQ